MKLARSSEKMNELHTFGGKRMNGGDSCKKTQIIFLAFLSFLGNFFIRRSILLQHATYTGGRETELGFLVKYRLRMSLKKLIHFNKINLISK